MDKLNYQEIVQYKIRYHDNFVQWEFIPVTGNMSINDIMTLIDNDQNKTINEVRWNRFNSSQGHYLCY